MLILSAVFASIVLFVINIVMWLLHWPCFGQTTWIMIFVYDYAVPKYK